MKVINFGSLNIDYVYKVDHIVRPEETVRAKKTSFFPGGKGLNQFIAIARSGANVFHAGCVGIDGDGAYLINILDKNGVNTSLVRKKEGTNWKCIYSSNTGRNKEHNHMWKG